MNPETGSINAYREFIKLFNFKGKVIYPCCGYDYLPSKVFDDVTFIDNDEKTIEDLKNRGLNAICGDVLEMNMDCELLIVINPSLSVEELLKSFSCKFILCNNLHGTADELRSIGLKEIDLGVPDYSVFTFDNF